MAYFDKALSMMMMKNCRFISNGTNFTVTINNKKKDLQTLLT